MASAAPQSCFPGLRLDGRPQRRNDEARGSGREISDYQALIKQEVPMSAMLPSRVEPQNLPSSGPRVQVAVRIRGCSEGTENRQPTSGLSVKRLDQKTLQITRPPCFTASAAAAAAAAAARGMVSGNSSSFGLPVNPCVYLSSQKEFSQEYSFDEVFGPDSTQKQVYEETTQPLLPRVVEEGIHATVFAYGATGAGKTYTMMGTDEDPGITKRAIHDIFGHINRLKELDKSFASHVSGPCHRPSLSSSRSNRLLQNPSDSRDGKLLEYSVSNRCESCCGCAFLTKCEVTASYLEVYNERIRDLLEPTKRHLEVQEDAGKVRVNNLSEHVVEDPHQTLELLAQGNRLRCCAATAANLTSSRSHAIFQLTIRSVWVSKKDANSVKIESKLSLIDLAGSERASATANRGRRLKEGCCINQSLLALANCINALHLKQQAQQGTTSSATACAPPATTIMSSLTSSLTRAGGSAGGQGATGGGSIIKTRKMMMRSSAEQSGGGCSSSASSSSGIFVNYRNSKLTHLLKSSLEGSCMVVMIANVHPAAYAYAESSNTLKYANRAKNLRVNPQVLREAGFMGSEGIRADRARLLELLQERTDRLRDQEEENQSLQKALEESGQRERELAQKVQRLERILQERCEAFKAVSPDGDRREDKKNIPVIHSSPSYCCSPTIETATSTTVKSPPSAASSSSHSKCLTKTQRLLAEGVPVTMSYTPLKRRGTTRKTTYDSPKTLIEQENQHQIPEVASPLATTDPLSQTGNSTSLMNTPASSSRRRTSHTLVTVEPAVTPPPRRSSRSVKSGGILPDDGNHSSKSPGVGQTSDSGEIATGEARKSCSRSSPKTQRGIEASKSRGSSHSNNVGRSDALPESFPAFPSPSSTSLRRSLRLASLPERKPFETHCSCCAAWGSSGGSTITSFRRASEQPPPSDHSCCHNEGEGGMRHSLCDARKNLRSSPQRRSASGGLSPASLSTTRRGRKPSASPGRGTAEGDDGVSSLGKGGNKLYGVSCTDESCHKECALQLSETSPACIALSSTNRNEDPVRTYAVHVQVPGSTASRPPRTGGTRTGPAASQSRVRPRRSPASCAQEGGTCETSPPRPLPVRGTGESCGAVEDQTMCSIFTESIPSITSRNSMRNVVAEQNGTTGSTSAAILGPVQQNCKDSSESLQEEAGSGVIARRVLMTSTVARRGRSSPSLPKSAGADLREHDTDATVREGEGMVARTEWSGRRKSPRRFGNSAQNRWTLGDRKRRRTREREPSSCDYAKGGVDNSGCAESQAPNVLRGSTAENTRSDRTKRRPSTNARKHAMGSRSGASKTRPFRTAASSAMDGSCPAGSRLPSPASDAGSSGVENSCGRSNNGAQISCRPSGSTPQDDTEGESATSSALGAPSGPRLLHLRQRKPANIAAGSGAEGAAAHARGSGSSYRAVITQLRLDSQAAPEIVGTGLLGCRERATVVPAGCQKGRLQHVKSPSAVRNSGDPSSVRGGIAHRRSRPPSHSHLGASSKASVKSASRDRPIGVAAVRGEDSSVAMSSAKKSCAPTKHGSVATGGALRLSVSSVSSACSSILSYASHTTSATSKCPTSNGGATNHVRPELIRREDRSRGILRVGPGRDEKNDNPSCPVERYRRN
ncbi:kinesin motor domain-containing protein [Cystoisospora suis]|uniref:Kinesin motor domain-containing protein n=1 Tax=Cystoisospora suis TaxID=483139 RepID=A0A2C6LC33_9APIC|nr:kinesin motor domain-containing protein [Cystoisospora suis]